MAIANVNAPRGFTLFRKGGKTEPNMVERRAASSRSKDIMIGDAYEVQADGTVLRASDPADTAHGIVVGIRFTALATRNVTESQDYIPAASEGWVIGCEDRHAQFEVQADSAAETNFDGGGASLADADGSQTLAQSRQSVIVAGGNEQFLLVQLSPREAENSEGAFAKVLVTLKNAFGEN